MPGLNSVAKLESLRKQLLKERKKFSSTIIVCGGTGCQASRCLTVIDAVKVELAGQGLEKIVRVRTTGCHGFCEQGPIMVIEPGNIFYCH
ncbi:MAG: (2Fe-2S) ferredoxin domain-containing protein [Deltaproteobacteria bacterium]